MRLQPIVWKKRLLLFTKKALKLELAKIETKIAQNYEWLAQKASLQKTKIDEGFYAAQLLRLWEQNKAQKKSLEVVTKQTEKLESLEEKTIRLQTKTKELAQESEAGEFKTAGFIQNTQIMRDKSEKKEGSFVSTGLNSEPKHVALLESGGEKVYIEYLKSSSGEGVLSFDFNHNNHQSLNEFRKQILKRLRGSYSFTSLYINGNNA